MYVDLVPEVQQVLIQLHMAEWLEAVERHYTFDCWGDFEAFGDSLSIIQVWQQFIPVMVSRSMNLG